MVLLLALPLLFSTVQDPAPAPVTAPLTAAEQSGFTRTSRAAEVDAFVEALAGLPHAQRLVTTTFGASLEGRPLRLVTVASPRATEELARSAAAAGERLRILVNANIHAGEVEGKEAVQILLRELALGEHAELLEHAVLYFVPIYNVDGNERIDPANRARQNGPPGGVGVRENAQGLDLNRDFVKAETPECRALLGLFRRLDPHVFMDLHTTNGSAHGYHLTYSPSLSTNVERGLDAFARETLLPEVTRALLEGEGFRVWHYGNFTRGGERAWETYDHRPRFGTNYYAIRGRVAVLSEAYSYIDLAERVRVTRAFVLETARAAVRQRALIRALCATADENALVRPGAIQLPHDTELAGGGEHEVLVGSVERDGERRVAAHAWRAERMPVRIAFRSRAHEDLPGAWALPAPSAAVLEALRLHGLELATLAGETEVPCRSFALEAVERAGQPFQGHEELTLAGAWREPAPRTLPAGTLIVPARQRLARLAAQLLEPESEDSLATWNFFDADLAAGTEGAGRYPVLRLGPEGVAALVTQPVAALE